MSVNANKFLKQGIFRTRQQPYATMDPLQFFTKPTATPWTMQPNRPTLLVERLDSPIGRLGITLGVILVVLYFASKPLPGF